MPEIMNFKSLKDSISSPIAPNKDCLDVCDYAKFGRAE